MRTVEVKAAEDIYTDELRGRFQHSGQASNMRSFIVGQDDGAEVAYLSFDTLSQAEQVQLWLHELWVVRRYRGRGFGNVALAAARRIARQSGYDRLLVVPKAIDPCGLTQEDLVAWYLRRGYCNWPDNNEALVCQV